MLRSPLRVLVIEGREDSRIALSSLLAGHEVSLADSGETALGLLGHQAFDIVFFGLQLPGMNALEACRRIRRLPEPEKAALPIIGLAAATAAPPEPALVLFDAWLVRPFGREQLLGLVDRLTDGAVDRRHLADVLSDLSPDRRSALADAAADAIAGALEDIAGAMADTGAGKGAGGIATAAHRLASAAGMCGLARVRMLAQRIEAAARAGELAPCPALLAEARAVLDDDLAHFSRFLRSLSAGLA